MRIHLTGRITIEDGEHVLDERELPGRQGRAVFARLAWEDGPVHRDVLADQLWPDGLPSTWERTLISVVSRLRSAVSGIEGLTISNALGCYELEYASDPQIDVRRARSECDIAERALAVGDVASAASSASVASAIARRPFLAGDDSPWVEACRSELRALLTRALEVGAEAALGTSEAVSAAGEAVEIDPYRERANLLLIRAHEEVGNAAEALRSYERYRSLLAGEFGTDPGPEVQAVYLELLRGEDASGRSETREGQDLVGLPRTHTSFVGREDALGAVGKLVRSERLITLTGAGGVGKTRLAIEVARRSLDLFPDGLWLVDLAPFSGSAPIIEHVAVAIGRQCSTGDSLASALDGQQMLLILDNCEQILERAGALAERLLGSTTGPVVLATSRSALNVPGEHVWRVPSLRVPGEDESPDAVESVALFRDRAAAVRPDFELTSANAPAIASICQRLDGVPLAIELAAARVSALGANEIDSLLDDRFAQLRGPAAGIPRHRTLRTAIDWSYDMLGPEEAKVFRRLSVFEGSFSAEEASVVCGRDVTDDTAALCERSLLTFDDGWYRMLETIKEYARERADSSEDWGPAVDSHLDWFLELIPQLTSGRSMGDFLPAVARARADVIVALERALARGRISDAIGLARPMGRFWLPTGLWDEARTYLERMLEAARAAGRTDETGVVLSSLGKIALNAQDFDYADELWREALAIAERRGDDEAEADALAELAAIAYTRGHQDDAERSARRAFQLADAIGDDFGAARVLLMLSGDVGVRGDVEEARRMAEQAIDRFEKVGSQAGVARGLIVLAATSDPKVDRRSDWEDPLRRAAETSRANHDSHTEGMALFQLGTALAESDHDVEALDVLKEGLSLARRIGDRWTALNCVEQIGLIDAVSSRPTRALMLLAAVSALRVETALSRSYNEADRYDQARERAMSEAGAGADASIADGSRLSFEAAVELAMSSET